MTLNPKPDNSTYHDSIQKIEDTEPNAINNLNQNIEVININHNNIEEIKLNSKTKYNNKKNNIISKSINILPSIQMPNDLETYKVYSYSGNQNSIKEITLDEKNSNNLIIQNETIITKEQPQKEIINNKEQSIDNHELNKKNCCECCNCSKCCECLKYLLYAILAILAIVTCAFLLGPACSNSTDCFRGCEDMQDCCECRCCKKNKNRRNE